MFYKNTLNLKNETNMKKLGLIILALILSQQIYSQMHISTNLREDFTWSDSQAKWIFVSQDPESSTLFDFNKEITMFKHTTESISSSYYVKSSSSDKEKGILELDVVSDVGNKYHVVVDPINKNIRLVGTDKNGTSFLVRHTIKKLWFEDK